jgi:predicted PurR-regulated permease PerM
MQEILHSKKAQQIFIGVLMLGAFFATIWVFWPFAVTLFMAGMFAILFHPTFLSLFNLIKSKFLAGVTTLILFFVVILIPVTLISGILFQELGNLYTHLTYSDGEFTRFEALQMQVQDWLITSTPLTQVDLSLEHSLKRSLDVLIQNTTRIFSGMAVTLLHIVIFFMAFFYMLVNGDRIDKTIKKFSLAKEKTGNILTSVKKSVRAIMKETLLLFVLRFIGIGLAFSIFGLPNALLWSLLGALVAIIPGIGTVIVLIPAFIYFASMGLFGSVIGLAIVGAILIVLVDNIIGPKLIEKDMSVHPFLILLSILGGMFAMGPVGFFVGPVFLGLSATLLKEYVVNEAKS